MEQNKSIPNFSDNIKELNTFINILDTIEQQNDLNLLSDSLLKTL